MLKKIIPHDSLRACFNRRNLVNYNMASGEKKSLTHIEKTLKEKGFDVKKITPLTSEKMEVHANTLHPIQNNQTGEVNVPVPVRLTVSLDNKGGIKNIEGASPTPEAVRDAEHFVKTLVDNNQLGMPGQPSSSHQTHQIEINKQGQKVLTRKNFSAF